MVRGRHRIELAAGTSCFQAFDLLLGRGFDGAVREVEGLTAGGAGVQGDGVVVHVSASGGTGEKGPELVGGYGHEMGAVSEGGGGNGNGGADVVGERG